MQIKGKKRHKLMAKIPFPLYKCSFYYGVPMTKPPIAIVGIGCRFPGKASDPKKFWNLLCEGGDAIVDVPDDRWDMRRFYDADPQFPGKMNARRGGFLKEKWEEFDAEFFHISPREAKFLDPQQRLLLELAWEAMEDGGLIPEHLQGSNGGVFIGAFNTDWMTLQSSPFNRHYQEMYSGINFSHTILSARLSHFFDLKGPSFSVDTACSSSLVAVHLACQSLWQNECSFALAGGVNAMLVPETSLVMSKGHFLNPDGQCRSFDKDANGYVRGEGGGIVILKPLPAAIRDGDPVYALIRGTGINQDGYTQGGITQPNSEAQQTLLQKVLNESGVSPADIHYIEAHGTGTPVGDPIEAEAIGKVLGKRTLPCYLGSVKSNIGHLEAAAGIAGLIKAALCLNHRKIPPNLHFVEGNPLIPFEKYRLEVPTAIKEFTGSFSLVNSFGYGGTNANALLEKYDEKKNASPAASHPLIFPFSAKNPENLKDMALSLHHFLHENPQTGLTDLAHTLAYKRSQFDYRLSIAAESAEELQKKLLLAAKGETAEGSAKGKALAKSPVAFVYTGMGPQWWGMGRELLKSSPVFLKIMQKCDQTLLPLAGWSLLEELQKPEGESRIDQPEISQPANYSLQAALTEVLKEWGIQPDFIIGHSIGEVAAAYASGALTLEEGLQVSYHRSRLQAKRKNLGTMLAIGLGKEAAQPFLQEKISLAAVNSENSVTLSGDKIELEKAAGLLEKKEIYNRFLKVNIAYHSYQMEGLEEEVHQALSQLAPKKGKIPFFSTVHGDEISGELLDSRYWWKNIRQPVLFAPALQKLIGQGVRLFVEIGPHPVLGSYIKETGHPLETVATLNRKKSDKNSLLECLGNLFAHGYNLSFDKINGGGNFIRLPYYPWRKKTHWIESEDSRQYRLSLPGHVMLSNSVKAPIPTWKVEVNAHFFPWLKDHQIEGTTVFPGAAYVEAGLALHSAVQGKAECCLEEIAFHQLLAVPKNKEPILQISLDPETKVFKVYSLSASHENEWTCHASGKCRDLREPPIAKLEPFPGEAIEGEALYALFTEMGLEYGPQFQGIKRLWKREREALAEIHVPATGDLLPPPLLDAAFQTLIGAVEEMNGVILPGEIRQLNFYRTPGPLSYCLGRCTRQTADFLEGDLAIFDQQGNLAVQIKGLKCRILAQKEEMDKLLYTPVWVEMPLTKREPAPAFWLIDSGFKEKIQEPCTLFSKTLLNQEAEKLIAPLAHEERLNIVLYYAPCDLNELASFEIEAVTALVNLVKVIEKIRGDKSTHLKIVTTNLSGSSLWGLARVIRQETDIRCSLIGLEGGEEIVPELFSDENEIAYFQKKRYACKIQRKDSTPATSPLQAFSLELKTPGLIESLYYQEIETPPPLPDEVAIRTEAASLNFKDLMKILGMLNRNALEGTFFGTAFGMECTGTIVAAGKKVKNYRVGDRVSAFTPKAFHSYITLKEPFVFPIPPGCTLEDGAIYVPFLTVLHALKEIGKLKKGETILIHSATGAVGLAAIQYAQSVGARLFATAGSEEKRTYLRNLGVERCFDSRTLTFADEILQATEGRGVDVVLNSLSGEALIKSWSLLAPYGRFLEIGKKDISINSQLPMKDFNRNTLFASIDMDRIFQERHVVAKRLCKETFSLFEKGIFKPLPCALFPAKEAVEAFHYMARARQIGKIMLKFGGETVTGVPLNQKPLLHSDASYLITGGFSGFGLTAAQWLAEKGAKHLILIGRSGASSKEAEQALEKLARKGVSVKAAAVDVADFSQMQQLLRACQKEMPPIKGVIHSAMVLQDAFLSQLTPEAIRRVLLPKVGGALNLHRLTSGLDFFVLFSSISSLIGNPGQGNYAAANAFLDAFCHYRKSLGLPGTTINWGALKTGVLSRNNKVAKHLAHHGINSLPAKTALNLLEKAILANERQLCAFDIDWKKLMSSQPAMKEAFAFADFRQQEDVPLCEKLGSMDEKERCSFITARLREVIGKTLKMDPEKIDPSVRLNTLGIDSLMTMELIVEMENSLGVKVPIMELMKGPSISQLVQVILKLMS